MGQEGQLCGDGRQLDLGDDHFVVYTELSHNAGLPESAREQESGSGSKGGMGEGGREEGGMVCLRVQSAKSLQTFSVMRTKISGSDIWIRKLSVSRTQNKHPNEEVLEAEGHEVKKLRFDQEGEVRQMAKQLRATFPP